MENYKAKMWKDLWNVTEVLSERRKAILYGSNVKDFINAFKNGLVKSTIFKAGFFSSVNFFIGELPQGSWKL
jgi:hypothetical protein